MTHFALSIHLMAILPAVGLGAVILWQPKGTKFHKVIGRSYSGLVFIGVLSSLGIRTEQGDFTHLHLLFLILVCLLLLALRAIRSGHIPPHRFFMLSCYGILVVTEILAQLPGQLFHSLLFG